MTKTRTSPLEEIIEIHSYWQDYLIYYRLDYKCVFEENCSPVNPEYETWCCMREQLFAEWLNL